MPKTELRNPKIESLPGDLKKIALEMIAEKFPEKTILGSLGAADFYSLGIRPGSQLHTLTFVAPYSSGKQFQRSFVIEEGDNTDEIIQESIRAAAIRLGCLTGELRVNHVVRPW